MEDVITGNFVTSILIKCQRDSPMGIGISRKSMVGYSYRPVVPKLFSESPILIQSPKNVLFIEFRKSEKSENLPKYLYLNFQIWSKFKTPKVH